MTGHTCYFINYNKTYRRIDRDSERNSIKKKPLVLEDCNTGKSYVDRFDKMYSRSTPQNKTVKWPIFKRNNI